MTTVVSPMDPRVAAVLERAATWTPARRKSDGRPFFIIPAAQAGAAYYSDETACTCPAARHGRDLCKHSRAVRLHNVATGRPSPAIDLPCYPETPGSWKHCRCGALIEPSARRCDTCSERLRRIGDELGV